MDPGRREPGLDEVIASGAVRSVYQPVVALETGAVVGWEALTRGPSGSALERPDALFAAASRAGRLEELDWVCRKAAVEGALAAGLDAGPTALFVNVEPATLGSALPPGLAETLDRAAGLRIVLEVTERAILTRPAALLAAVEFARERGWGMALDDVGVNPESLAMVPFVRPDVVKLDMSLVQGDVGPDLAYVATAVMAYAERTGAAILAEGIETPAHLERARTLGATLGQGWHFGRPVDRPVAGSEGVSVAAARATSGAGTPVEAVRAAGRRFQTGPVHAARHLPPPRDRGDARSGPPRVAGRASSTPCTSRRRRRPATAGWPSTAAWWLSSVRGWRPSRSPESGGPNSPPTTRWWVSGRSWSSGLATPVPWWPGTSATISRRRNGASSSPSPTIPSSSRRWPRP